MWSRLGARWITDPFIGRPATVDARDDRVGLAPDLGRAEDVGVGAELLDHVDHGGQAEAR